jgi:hypothetical protein
MSRNKAALEKARKNGVQKVFYVTSPAGWTLSEMLPRIDMVTRLLANNLCENNIEDEEYKNQKDMIFEYLEGVDSWSNEVLEQIIGYDKEISKIISNHREHIKQKKYFNFNTQTGINAYQSFVKCDAVNRSLVFAIRFDIITEKHYSKFGRKLFTILANFKNDIENMRKVLWKLHKSNGHGGRQKSRVTKNS